MMPVDFGFFLRPHTDSPAMFFRCNLTRHYKVPTINRSRISFYSTSSTILGYWRNVFTSLAKSKESPQKICDRQVTFDQLQIIRNHFRLKNNLYKRQSKLLPELITEECMKFYCTLDLTIRKEFLEILVKDFGVATEELQRKTLALIDILKAQENNQALLSRTLESLSNEILPLYVQFFKQILLQENGLGFLLKVREDLLKMILTEKSSELKGMDNHLKKLLQDWFSGGFLQLKEISWEQSPASLIEYVKDNEAVHKVTTMEALKQRMTGNRKAFAFCHLNMPQEPIAFIMVALTDSISASMKEITSGYLEHPADPFLPKCAIFYSIISTARGLSGIDVGASLIKSTVAFLQSQFPTSLRQFCTLSPIPGFKKWLVEFKLNSSAFPAELAEFLFFVTILVSMDETATNFKSFIIRNKDQLCHLCLHYLLKEKRVTGNALDPVANFHLTNGASLYRLNFLAHDDVVHNESFGLMVNYLYDLNSVAENSQNYIMDGKMQTDLYL